MSFLFKPPTMPSIVTPPTPAMPTPIPSEAEIKKKEKARMGSRGTTILTGPRGVLTEAKVERKFLLGQ